MASVSSFRNLSVNFHRLKWSQVAAVTITWTNHVNIHIIKHHSKTIIIHHYNYITCLQHTQGHYHNLYIAYHRNNTARLFIITLIRLYAKYRYLVCDWGCDITLACKRYINNIQGYKLVYNYCKIILYIQYILMYNKLLFITIIIIEV
jgi:hypothetical protein